MFSQCSSPSLGEPPPAPLRRSAFASGAAPLLLGLALGSAGCGAALPSPESSLYWLPGADDDGCTPAVTRIEAVDEPTPLGFSAIDALLRLAGPRSSPLVWLEPESNEEYLLTLGPESGRSTLDLDLRAQDGPVLHRFRTPRLGAPEDTECDPGALEIPISVTLESGSQGLSESFDAVLEVRTPYRGHVLKQLEPSTLRGSLGLASVASLDPARSFWLAGVRLTADIWEGGSAGALSVEIGASHARASTELRLPAHPPAPPGSIAAWPSATACEGGGDALPSDAKVLGFSVDDVLDELRRGGARRATWSDGGEMPLELELAADTSELCQQVGDSLSFSAMLRARSDGGGIDVRSAVVVDALDAGGRVGAIRIESAEPNTPYLVAPGASTPSSPNAGEGYASVLVGVEWTHDGAHDSGSLSLRGVDTRAPDPGGVYPSTALGNARW